jgi:hypothetical protein
MSATDPNWTHTLGSRLGQKPGSPARSSVLLALSLHAMSPAGAQPQEPQAATNPSMRLEVPFAAGNAQNPSAPLQCKRAQVTVVARPCPQGNSCQAGTTPGIAQLMGPAGQGVRGGALAFGSVSGSGQRSVNFNVLVPDVTDFVPASMVKPRPTRTELWVVKRSQIPAGGVGRVDIADHTIQVHNNAPFGVARIGTTLAATTDNRVAGKVASPWQVVGLVSARHGTQGKWSTHYGFVCELPVTNLPPPAR